MDIRQAAPGAASLSHARAAYEIVSPHLGQLAQEFCAALTDAGASPSPSLADAMKRYWQDLLSASGPETIARDLGKNPVASQGSLPSVSAIIAAYDRVIASALRMVAANLRASKAQACCDALRAAFCTDMGALLGRHMAQANGSGTQASSEIQAISEIIERETDNIISEVGFQAGRMKDVSLVMETDSRELSKLVERITETTGIASGNVATVASATEELQSSSQEIAQRIHRTSDISNQAVSRVEETTGTMASLSNTAGEIGKVVDIVKRISDQTKMLALNATIEAARAGDAGKGFAVVANEVKNLATQTEKAISDINAQIQAIQQATSSAVNAIEGIGGAIDEVSRLSNDISGSVEQQTAAINEISASAKEVSSHMQGIADDIGLAHAKAQNASDTSENLRGLASNIRRDVTEMDQRFRAVLRTTSTKGGKDGAPGEKARQRVPIAVDIDLDFGNGDRRKGVTADMSTAGLLARIEATEKDAGKPVSITLDNDTHLHGTLKAVSSLGAHIQFDQLTAEAHRVIDGMLVKTRAHDEKIAELGKPLAQQLGKLFDDAVRRGELKLEDLMRPKYKLIDGSDPKQFTTPFLQFTDTHFAPLQEATLGKDQHIVFVAAVDQNGYLPTHNKVFSQPQRPNDPVWNMGNSRNRRIFDDRAGLMAARNTKPVLLQTYFRDMGDRVVFMKECDVPIVVNGKNWGNLRIGYRA
ncbi:methyl-accepting chemotaxis protein [Thalassospira marina]|uniref:Chemotaxis protein n=1 Tax=Thalassospira marina TaxID=2048283 RepID=A0A2N3KUE5_9PROT|nr:methyl-accepting chemotaxis protein [Thalassospira marina]PKR54093.1 chemotaxis protein [Thalassospira marina]